MRAAQIALLFIVLVALPGCASKPFSLGKTTRTPTGERNLAGIQTYTTTDTPRPVAMAETLAPALAAIQPEVDNRMMPELTVEQIASLPATVGVEYMRSIGLVDLMSEVKDMIGLSLNRPMSSADAVARQVALMIASSENGLSDRFDSMGGNILKAFGLLQLRKGHESTVEGLRDVGISAAVNGGDLTVTGISTSQNPSAGDSGAVGGAGGELGGAGGAGTASSSASATKDGDKIIIARNVTNVEAAADSKVMIGVDKAVQAAPSSSTFLSQGDPIGNNQADDLEVNAAPNEVKTVEENKLVEL